MASTGDPSASAAASLPGMTIHSLRSSAKVEVFSEVSISLLLSVSRTGGLNNSPGNARCIHSKCVGYSYCLKTIAILLGLKVGS